LVGQDDNLRQEISAALTDSKWYIQEAAIKVLAGQVGQDENVTQKMMACLYDEKWYIRHAAIQSLAGQIEQDEKIYQEILVCLEDSDYRVRQVVIQALERQIEHDQSLRQIIFSSLKDSDYRVRQTAAQVLVKVVGQDREITLRLLPWLGFIIEQSRKNETAQQTRCLVANAYGPLLAHDPALFKQVVEMLNSPSWAAREGAARALIAMPDGPPAHLMPKLRGLIHDNRAEESWPERLQVAELLINNRDYELSQKAIQVTLEALDFATQLWYHMPKLGPQVRRQAAQILGQLDPLYRDEKVFARLMRVLEEDKDEEVRDAAYGALLRLAAAPER